MRLIAQTLGGQITSRQTVFTAEASASTTSVLPDLESLDFSGLYATDSSSTTTSSQRIITTTGSYIASLTTSSSAIASNFASSSKLNATDTGVIIGGSIIGVIIILGITLCTCILANRSRTRADRLSFNPVLQEAVDVLSAIQFKKTSKDSRVLKFEYLPQENMRTGIKSIEPVKLPSRDSTIDAYFEQNLHIEPPPSFTIHSSPSPSDVSRYSTGLHPTLQEIYRKNNKYEYI
ncbi:hypothetical protein CU098_012201 [Rhizopus stolonifer]|uniref:Mid2 domain-containing protein n=1 Tax=Rhizopus stolonifer TaxID=4846 RepID=A0A367KRC7_RHIST|nr:hypothetical protein CU098_012201 [Rhizopus stolonifer]